MSAGSSFSERVYSATKRIRKGSVATYKEIAKAIGHPGACRAVGNALNKNVSASIPCHRVIRSDMRVGGFRDGVIRKIKLLKSEESP
jgi:O-6-methylguanine DNA methyltransferase